VGHGRNGVTWQAPGRVNLIGEHTDYNAGFVLPFAIEQACTATVERIDERTLAISSTQRAETPHFALDGLEPGAADGWAGYAAGVVWALLRLGADVPGLRIALDSTVPPGAGLSFSAALTCAVATAVDDLLGLRLSAGELLSVTRSAENDFVGAPTGGMDQLAALNCTAGNALFCDMRTLETEHVPLPLAASGLTILVVDTHAAHRHADGEYQLRRAGCERRRAPARADLATRTDRRRPRPCPGSPPERRPAALHPTRRHRERTGAAHGRPASRRSACRDRAATDRLARIAARRLPGEHHRTRRRGRNAASPTARSARG